MVRTWVLNYNISVGDKMLETMRNIKKEFDDVELRKAGTGDQVHPLTVSAKPELKDTFINFRPNAATFMDAEKSRLLASA